MICLAQVWTVVPRELCVFLQAGRYATKQWFLSLCNVASGHGTTARRIGQ